MNEQAQTYLAGPELSLQMSGEPSIQHFMGFIKQPKTKSAKRSSLNIKKIVQSKKASNYYWSDPQNKRYAIAVRKYSHLFSMTAQERRLKKVNVMLSQKVRTRTPLQCHSHHQKMLKKYGTVQAIIGLFASNERKEIIESQSSMQGEAKRRGRPRKNKIAFPEDPIPESPSPAIPVPDPAPEDLLFNVLELGKNDLEMQQFDRLFDERLRFAREEDQMIQFDF